MSQSRHVSRRQFLQTASAVAGGVAIASLASRSGWSAAPGRGSNLTVSLITVADAVTASPQVKWALDFLRGTLTAKGFAVVTETNANADIAVTICSGTSDAGRQILGKGNVPEALAFTEGKRAANSRTTAFTAAGADAAGLVYALAELADRVRCAPDLPAAMAALSPQTALAESPANPHRGIFRMFTSENEDKTWFYDREGWQKYFDMLVSQRFNRFNLSFGLSYDFATNASDTYTYFLYPFFVDVPGYKVRAIAKAGTPLPADEQKKNLDTLKFISDQAALRGIKFTVGIWTHAYHWTSSPNATFNIEGLDDKTQAPYSRDALKMLIDACPGITGITLRTHGESGVPEGSYDLWKIIMSGISGHKNPDGTNRTVELDLHGKTMTQEMIDTAMTTGQPVLISCKHWAEHMGLPYIQASIRESEMPKADVRGLMALSSGSRNFLRYGVGDLLRKDRNYKLITRVWPGTQHLLLWGDPLYAAELGRVGSFAGMDGIDFFEPLSFKGRLGSSANRGPQPDRTGYVDNALRPQHEWEKYLYTLRLWGRLSYNPDAKPETWQRQLKSDFGAVATPLETALANASRILPLITTAHLPSAASASYWPEMYTTQSIFNSGGSPYSEAPTPRVFGNVSPLDPQIFATINQYVDSLLANKPEAKVSPLDVARQLDTWSDAARRALADASKVDADRPADKAAAQRRAQIDTSIVAGLGTFFAHKYRAAILWQLFNLSGHEPARTAAVEAYKKAHDAWVALADTAKVYGPNQPYGTGRTLQGHWSDRLTALSADVTGLATAAPEPRTPAPAPADIDKLIALVTNPIHPALAATAKQHTPPTRFTPGQPLALELRTAADFVRLCYRHLHQGQRYATVDMAKTGNTFTAAIPADYTNSPFPLQYYFEIRAAASATLFPGFKSDFTGTPYFHVLPA